MDNSGTVRPDEDIPVVFKEFEDFILWIAPDILFRDYRLIYEKSVLIERKEESDYYGGSTTHCNFCANLNIAYKILRKFGYIDKKKEEDNQYNI